MNEVSNGRAMPKRIVLVVLLAALLGTLGCAGVKPYQREFLADRIMDPSAMRWEQASERKMLSTREGASGGALGAGGGCACN